MIAQQELHNLLNLPLAERLRIAQRLIESALAETDVQAQENQDQSQPLNPLMAVAGMFSGKPVNTAEKADEICLAEVNRRSGFTTKPPLEE